MAENGMRAVWLIERLVIDDTENAPSAAMWYEALGCVLSEDAANETVAEGGLVAGTGWPIPKGESLPFYRARKLAVLQKGFLIPFAANTIAKGARPIWRLSA